MDNATALDVAIEKAAARIAALAFAINVTSDAMWPYDSGAGRDVAIKVIRQLQAERDGVKLLWARMCDRRSLGATVPA